MPANPTYFDVLQLLDDEAIGQIGTDLFGAEWGEPDAQVLVLEGVGVPSDLPTVFEQPGVQVMVRGDKRAPDVDVYRKAKVVYDFLATRSDCLDVNGTQYAGFEPTSNLAPLGKDDQERFIYSMNFYTYRNGAEGP